MQATATSNSDSLQYVTFECGDESGGGVENTICIIFECDDSGRGV